MTTLDIEGKNIQVNEHVKTTNVHRTVGESVMSEIIVN